MSLRRRIMAAAALAVAGVAVMLAVAGYLSTRSELTRQIRQELRQRSLQFINSASGGHSSRNTSGASDRAWPGGGPSACTSPGRSAGGSSGSSPASRALVAENPYFVSVCRGGRLVTAAGETPMLPVPAGVREIARVGRGSLYFPAAVHGVDVEVYAFADPVDAKANELALSLAPVNSALHALLMTYLWLIGVGVVVAGLAGLLISRSALAPIRRFSADTERVTRSPDRRRRLEESGAEELRRLASSFNHTLDALERSLESQRHLIADASHELRTPMAALRSNIQIFLDADRLPAEDRRELQHAILAELDELATLVSDVLQLARGSMPTDRVEAVELHEVVYEAVDRAHRRAPALELDLDVEPTVVVGSPELVGRAVSNLIDNARTWSGDGETIEITLRDGLLTVRDHGPGFAEDDLGRVFDRFYRSDHARRLPGSGLGLAIVRQAAEAHGGFATAVNAPDGGAILRVSFGPPVPTAPDVAPVGRA
ncbi:MAG TPA: HAMP domain-containing sensor histidine kinase [Solirubrobacteraceae bacterium]|nr:HAMP domain-containing sensor histidine kinase [Solirubrobacteraceae bacterium]